jgi:hypothetical protein
VSPCCEAITLIESGRSGRIPALPRYLRDDRQQRVDHVLSSRDEDQRVGHERREHGDPRRVAPQHGLGELEQVVEPARRLHDGQRRDHGDDHAEHRAGRTSGRHPEHEHEYEQPEPRDRAQADPADARADQDARQQDREA